MASGQLGITHISASQNNKEATANAAFDALDDSVNKVTTKSISGNVTLTASEWTGGGTLKFTGTLSANATVTVPATARKVAVWNATTGGYSITFVSASPSSPAVDVTVSNGTRTEILSDGADIYDLAGNTSSVSSVNGQSGDVTLTLGTRTYDFGFNFTTTPTGGDVLGDVMIGRAITIPASSNIFGDGDTNPDASYEIDVQDDGVSVGTITVTTGGAVSLSDGASPPGAISIAAGSRVQFIAPTASPAEASIANWTFTILATVDS